MATLAPKKFDWTLDTSPFATADGSQPGRFELRQIADDEFELVTPFRYQGRDGKVIPVTSQVLGRTDLASIPSFLGWFARRHGRHTPAAVLHDMLTTGDPDSLPPDVRIDPVSADRIFREAMLASDVPHVRAWVMWAAVAFRTRWVSRPTNKVLLGAWIATAVAGTGVLVYGVRRGKPELVALALLAPAPASLLWGRQWVGGLIAGYAFWPVLVGSLPAWTAYKFYEGVESLYRIGRDRLTARRTAPPPPTFSER
jgi:hypothetical protein